VKKRNVIAGSSQIRDVGLATAKQRVPFRDGAA
jgi:hypothetical protein